MEEDDSQDELINRNASHVKGKRPVSSIFTDEEGDTDEAEEAEYNSEESENSKDGDLQESDDDDDEDDSDESDGNEDSGKVPEGAGGTADGADLSSDEEAEKCPICLNSFQQQPVATPETCEHYFCLDCILEWSKNANSCPVDRIVFKNIYLRKCYRGKIQKMITVQKLVKAAQEVTDVDLDLDQTSCEVCGRSDREDRLLLCDGCDAGYHMECLTPPLNAVPVEEWFCPECAANIPHAAGSAEEVSDDEVETLLADAVPTTSRLRPSNVGPTRAIARTRQSERVRATVNRNRITQARTIQHVPRYLVQSTWLDETIEAVVAGLNTAVYVRDLSPRVRTRARRKSAKRRKTKNKKSGVKASSDKSGKPGARRRRRRAKRSKSRRKQELKKEVTPRSRLAKSLGIGMPLHGSAIPSVYRPAEQSLGSMRADIGAASLSVYGDPFDLDPFDAEDEQTHQSLGLSQLLDAKRRGLSRSAMRSHQPVAQPILAALHRRGLSIPEAEVAPEAAPVPDLLGSILTGQSILMMDSSDVVINRDGSLKVIKPVTIASPKTRIPSGGMCESGAEIHVGASPSSAASAFDSNGVPGPPGGFSARSSPPFSFPSPSTPTSPRPPSFSPQRHPALPGGSCVPLRSPVAQSPTSPGIPCEKSPGSQYSIGPASCSSQSSAKEATAAPVRKPLSKPVWLDVSGLPRIPKIKRETPSGSVAGGNSRGPGCSGMPDSCVNNLTGHKVQQQATGQGVSGGEREKAGGSSHRQLPSGPGATSGSLTGNPGSSAVSFRISTSGNSWHARRLAHAGAQGSAPGQEAEEPWKKLHESKRLLLSSRAQSSKKPDKSEIYDPFEPTGSDSDSTSSSSEEEAAQATESPKKEVLSPGSDCNQGDIRYAAQQVKTETVDSDNMVLEECSGNSTEVTKKPECIRHFDALNDSLQSICRPEGFSVTSLSLPQEGQTVITSQRVCQVNKEGESSQVFTRLSQRQVSSTSSSASSQESEKKYKTEAKSVDPKYLQSWSRSRSRSLSSDTDRKGALKGRKTMTDNRCTSSSPDSGRKRADKRKSGESRPQHSHAKGRKGGRSSSDTESEGGKRSRRKKRRLRSRSRERRRSRSGSVDRSRRRTHRRENREQSNSKSTDRKRSSTEKQRGRSWSRSKTRSRSRSRERRKDQSGKTKEGVRSRSKDRRCPRSRSRSSEKKRETHPSERSQPTEKTSHLPTESSVLMPREDREHKEVVGKPVSLSVIRDKEEPTDKRNDNVSVLKAVDEEAGCSSEMKREKADSLSISREEEEKETKVSSLHSLVIKMKGVTESKNETGASLSALALSVAEVVKRPKEATVETATCLGVVREAKGPSEVKGEKPTSSSGEASLPHEDRGHDSRRCSCDAVVEAKSDAPLLKNVKTEPFWPEELIHLFAQSNALSSPSQTAVTEHCHMGCKAGLVKQEASSAGDGIYAGHVLDTLMSIKSELLEATETGSSREGAEVPTEEPKSLSVIRVGEVIPVKQEQLSENRLEEATAVSLGEESSVKQEGTCTIEQKRPPEIKQETESSVQQEGTCTIEQKRPPEIKQETESAVKEEEKPSFKQGEPPTVKLESLSAASLETPSTAQQEVVSGSRRATEPASAIVSTKSKPSVKRVTWNLKEADKPFAEKSGKFSHFRVLQSNREGARKLAGSSQALSQDLPQPTAPATSAGEPAVLNPNKGSLASVPHTAPCDSEAQPGQSHLSQGDSGGMQEVSRKDKYMKKLHMQERAVEEVKLAIKPFYQKRDITKDEYKEILRKAVQKVCHSKSGEINPVKVANLVKAYVEKYKHARKHKKEGEAGKPQDSNTKVTDSKAKVTDRA